MDRNGSEPVAEAVLVNQNKNVFILLNWKLNLSLNADDVEPILFNSVLYETAGIFI